MANTSFILSSVGLLACRPGIVDGIPYFPWSFQANNRVVSYYTATAPMCTSYLLFTN